MSRTLLGIAAAALLASGGARAETVSVWVHSGPGPERNAYAAAVAAFNDLQARGRESARAELVPVSEASYGASVERAAREGKLPCVLEFDGPNVAAYASAGHLVPLDRFSALAQTRSTMLGSLLRQGTVDGKLFSVAQYDSGLALWGNRRLLQQVGARIPTRVDDGWSLAEFEDVMRKLKAAGVPAPLDMKFNYGIGEWLTYGFAPLVQGFGADLVDPRDLRTARGVLNSAAAVRAMATLQGWIRSGYVDAAPADDSSFVSGRSALSWVGHWVYPEYRKALQQDLVLMPLPRFGPKTVTGSGSWSFGISSTCPHPEAAARFLEHLMSRAEILRVTEVNGAVPGTGAAMVYSRNYGPNGELRLYAEQLLAGLARVRPPSPKYPVISKAFSNAVSRIAKGADPQKTLDAAVLEIEAELKAH